MNLILYPFLYQIHKWFYNSIFNSSSPRYIKTNKPFILLTPSERSLSAVDTFDTFLCNNPNFLPSQINELVADSSQRNYSCDLFNFLPIEVQQSFYDLATCDPSINDWLLSYFGFLPHIHRISLLLNVSKDNSVEEGSKLWHRDDDCDFKNTKVFIPFTLQTPETGPFFYLSEPILYTKEYSLNPLLKSNDPWKRWRIPNESISNYGFSSSSLQQTPVGSMLCIDTVNVYHKGGYLTNGHRILMQISYQGDSHNSTTRQDLSYLSGTNNISYFRHQKLTPHPFLFLLDPLKRILLALRLLQPLKFFFKRLSSSRFYSKTLS